MKRRGFVRALVAAPMGKALLAQQQQVTPQQPGPAQPAPGIPLNPTQPVQPPGSAAREVAKLDPSTVDVAGETVTGFFDGPQMAALRRLSDLLMPKVNGRAGALDAKAPEFLDFLISQSPADRKDTYRSGLNALNAAAKTKFAKDFSDLKDQQAATLLAPLQSVWTYDTSADPIARFLRAAKQDVRTATVNSREYVLSGNAGAGARRGGGGGLYWYPLD